MKTRTSLTKRVVVYVLCLAMVITAINIPALVTDTKAAANITFYVDSIEYEVTSGADATVKVLGANKETIGNELSIPDEVIYEGVTYKVTEIAARAFADIDEKNPYNFVGDLVIGDNVTTIGDAAFAYGSFTGALKLGKSVAYIGEEAFVRCKFADELVIPANVREIKTGAFAYWDNLKKVTIKSDRTVIKQNAFVYDNIDTVKIAGTSNIDDYAFFYATVAKVVLPYDMDESEIAGWAIVKDYDVERYYAPEEVTVHVKDYDDFSAAVETPIRDTCTIVFDNNIVGDSAIETINVAANASAKNIIIDMNGYDLITAENSTGILFKLSNAVSLRVINSNPNSESIILLYSSGLEEVEELVMFDLECSDAVVDMYNVECILTSNALHFEPAESEQTAQLFNVNRGNVILRGGLFENYFSEGHVINDLTSTYQNNIMITGGAQLISANAPIAIGTKAPSMKIYDGELKVVGNFYDGPRVIDDTDDIIKIADVVGKNKVKPDNYSNAYKVADGTIILPTIAIGYMDDCDIRFESKSSEKTYIQEEFVTSQAHIWLDSETDGFSSVGYHVINDNSSPATCTEGGHTGMVKCSVCELLYSEDKLTPPHNQTLVEAVEATCGKDGVQAYYECECGKRYTDAECTQEITDFEAWAANEGKIPATGEHDYKDGKCVVCGKATKSGLIFEADLGKWCYYVNGEIATDFTGIVQNEGYFWYVANGMIDTNYTGFFENAAGNWYIAAGKIDTNFTGLGKNEDGEFVPVFAGKAYNTYTGLVKNAGYFWYCKDGRVDTTYTGFFENEAGKWWVAAGKVNTSFTGLGKDSDGNWRGVFAGKYVAKTGLVLNAGYYWYLDNGVLDTSYTGIVDNANQKWLVVYGKMVSDYTGEYVHEGVTYNVVNGRVV